MVLLRGGQPTSRAVIQLGLLNYQVDYLVKWKTRVDRGPCRTGLQIPGVDELISTIEHMSSYVLMECLLTVEDGTRAYRSKISSVEGFQFHQSVLFLSV